MKQESATHKAEGLRKAGTPSTNTQDQNDSRIEISTTGEQRFLDMLADFMRVAKSSDDPGVSEAARQWEATVGFNVKLQLQRRAKRNTLKEKRIVLTAPMAIVTLNGSAAQACPSSWRIRVGAPPGRA
jgi:hypothetical protein